MFLTISMFHVYINNKREFTGEEPWKSWISPYHTGNVSGADALTIKCNILTYFTLFISDRLHYFLTFMDDTYLQDIVLWDILITLCFIY